MLHELILALTGVQGDVIVNIEGHFSYAGGCGVLSDSETEQTNILAPLGSYYLSFQEFASSQNKCNNTSGMYYEAMMCGVVELLDEYAKDVIGFEVLVMEDGPITLSHGIQHFQKYLLVFPVLHALLKKVKTNGIRGCKLLDFFSEHSSGTPVVSDVLKRIIVRLRCVLVRQCLLWMMEGELADRGEEFFIRPRQLSSERGSSLKHQCSDVSEKVRQLLQQSYGESGGESTTGDFDWSHSYSFVMSQLPESHMSAKSASKVLFTGKALVLLRSGRENDGVLFSQTAGGHKNLLLYLSAGAERKREKNGLTAEQQTLSGYSPKDATRISALFAGVLQDYNNGVESLECAVDAACDAVSASLWRLLRDRLGFMMHLQILRNTYLLGQGELFQHVMDELELVSLSCNGLQPSALEWDRLLNWQMLRGAAQLFGLDEESISDLLRLSINSCSADIFDFEAHLRLDSVRLSGAAGSGNCGDILPSSTIVLRTTDASGCGGLWLRGAKSVGAGMTLVAHFSCMGLWSEGEGEVGSVACCLRGGEDADATDETGSDQLRVTVSLHACGEALSRGVHARITIDSPGSSRNQRSCAEVCVGMSDLRSFSDSDVIFKRLMPCTESDFLRLIVEVSVNDECVDGVLLHSVRARLAVDDSQQDSLEQDKASLPEWDVVLPVHLSRVTREKAVVGVCLSGDARVHRLRFSSIRSQTAYPAASSFTAAHFPDVVEQLEGELQRMQPWAALQLHVRLPALFQAVLDQKATSDYSRLFTLLFKVRMVSLALEKLWLRRVQRIADREFCHLRHAMHFFLANLVYYLQVDVIDSEFSVLQRVVSEASDLRTVTQAHRDFLSTVVRLSLMDHGTISECIDKVLHCCMRLLAVCRLQIKTELWEDSSVGSSSSTPPPIYVPPEEFGFIRRDFLTQTTLIFQILRDVNSRGFLFRLDFNGFLSAIIE